MPLNMSLDQPGPRANWIVVDQEQPEIGRECRKRLFKFADHSVEHRTFRIIDGFALPHEQRRAAGTIGDETRVQRRVLRQEPA